MNRLFLAAIAITLAACGHTEKPANAVTLAGGSGPEWHPSSTATASLFTVRLDAKSTVKDAQKKIVSDMCASAVLVWGDLKATDRARAINIAIGDGPVVIDGFLICESDMESFLKLQLDNPKLKAGHGGSADLTWRAGQLFLKRKWSAGEVQLARLSPPPDNVFQKGEVLAALFSCQEPTALMADVLDALSRVPKVFLFGMYPLEG